MSRPVVIETPFPSLEETADRLGLSHTRAKRVEKFAMTVLHGDGVVAKRRSGTAKRATKHAFKKAAKKR